MVDFPTSGDAAFTSDIISTTRKVANVRREGGGAAINRTKAKSEGVVTASKSTTLLRRNGEGGNLKAKKGAALPPEPIGGDLGEI